MTARNAATQAAAGGAGAGAGREGEVDDDDEGIPDLVENFEDAGDASKTAADLEDLE